MVAGGTLGYPPQAWRASACRCEADLGGGRPAAGQIAAIDGSGGGDAPGIGAGDGAHGADGGRGGPKKDLRSICLLTCLPQVCKVASRDRTDAADA